MCQHPPRRRIWHDPLGLFWIVLKIRAQITRFAHPCLICFDMFWLWDLLLNHLRGDLLPLADAGTPGFQTAWAWTALSCAPLQQPNVALRGHGSMLCIPLPQQLLVVPMQVSESTSARQMIYTLMDTNACASEFWHFTGCRKQRFVPGQIGVPCKHADLVKLHQSLLDAPDSNTRPSYDSAVEIQNSKCMRCKDLPEPHKNRKQQHHMQRRLCNWRLLDSSLAVFCSASNGPWLAFVGSVDGNQCARYMLVVLICTDESIRPKWPGRTKAHG